MNEKMWWKTVLERTCSITVVTLMTVAFFLLSGCGPGKTTWK